MRQPLRLVCVLLGAAASVSVAAVGQPPAPARLSMHVPVPPVVVPTDGRHRLLYELRVENHGPAAATLTGLDVRPDSSLDAATTIQGEALVRALDVPRDRALPLALAAGERRVIFMDVGVTTPPSAIRHALQFWTADLLGGITDGIPGLRVDSTPPVVLGPPLGGGPWAAVHHPEWERGHRRVFYTVDGVTRLPGRYTIDFVKLDDGGRTTRGDADLVGSALGYGAQVLAVADATVAAARDDMPEPPRVSARVKHPQNDAAGNYVALDLGQGRFAVYEHLKPGSIRAQPGQRVRRGEVIAALGFTGDSTGPHLHLHVGDAARPLAAEGRPFVFDRFEVLGRYPDIAAMGKAPWQRGGAGRRERERPGPNVVVRFDPPSAQ